MYKLTRPDGTDFYSGKINYAANIGKVIMVPNAVADGKNCGPGIHACKNPLDPFRLNAVIPCRAFRVKGIGLLRRSDNKSRYKGVKVIEEIKDLDTLFGFNYTEAANPINPFSLPAVTAVTEEHKALLREWASVSASVCASVRDSVCASVSASVRDSVSASVSYSVSASVYGSVYGYIGSLFPCIKKWKGINHAPGVYPFQSAVTLWKQGLVPSFDGTTWRLHTGNDAHAVYEWVPEKTEE